MLQWLWSYAASAPVSVAAGFCCLVVLLKKGLHRDSAGQLEKGNIAASVLQGAALYTVAITLVGHWAFHIPISVTVAENFSNDRFSWLLLGVLLDGVRNMTEVYRI